MLSFKELGLIVFFIGIVSTLYASEDKIRFEVVDKLSSYQAGKIGFIEVKIVNNSSKRIIYRKDCLYAYIKQVTVKTTGKDDVLSFIILGGDWWSEPVYLPMQIMKTNQITGKTECKAIPQKIPYLTLNPKESLNWKYSFEVPENYPLGETTVFLKFIYKTGEASASYKVNITKEKDERTMRAEPEKKE